MKLLKTGIAGLDEFLQGGLPPRTFLLLGPPGSGSEVFARQVAHARAKGVGITYFTVIRSADSVRDDMSAYGWQISSLEKAGKWRFINLNQAGSLTDVITREIGQHRSVVVDSLSELILTHEIREIVSLLDSMSVRNRDCQELHLILLTEGMQDPRIEITMQHFADGVIAFTTTQGTEASARHIMIKKIRGAVIPTRMLPYSIGERGFTIETATRIT
ncbi:MAG: RAD55 family ATPase [Candidatus Bathyarchaeia archaeon]|jgi:KaiC/GvpD/RAD55 family RecA-like ATPase